ncbi:MAG: alpha-galactosidase [Acetanaerobacterium sp.]
MPIIYDSKHQNFHLKAKETSYVIHIVDSKYLQHVYWGKRINEFNLDYLKRYVDADGRSDKFSKDNMSLDAIPQEYPSYGSSDLRAPAFQIRLENGSTITDLYYVDYKIVSGKKPLGSLPSCYVESDKEAQTLEITVRDDLCGVEAVLSYTVYEDYDAITRSVCFTNKGSKEINILRALSVNVDFDDHDFDMLQLSGSWARENHIIKRPLALGSQSIESRRGASSQQNNPFIALMRKNADEDSGDVYGLSFVYSGNFLANIEVEQFGSARVQMGINPFDFNWLLKSGEVFQTPEVVMVYSDSGIGKMSRTYHSLYRNRLCRGVYRDQNRPVVINNWEVTYFNFNEDKLKSLADEAIKLGVEVLVLDDGWFAHRDNDHSSLGDWYVNKTKLPNGLDGLGKYINDLGLKFGLWFEPEMISPDSDLYKAHPDWCIHVPGRDRTLSRNQLVLDLSRDDVCQTVTKMITDILSSAPISYVKWDMNRNMSEIGSAALEPGRQRETAHRYILGLYKMMETITNQFPDILFESCASGGARFDAGMLYYMPQTWTSDNTDAIERLSVQYGTSIVYPAVAMASHVSTVPNHQLHRTTPMDTRANVAMSGNLGYEFDLTKLSEEDKGKVKNQIEEYKQIRDIVQFGDLYRLKSPFDGNETAWMFISPDQKDIVVDFFKVLTSCNYKLDVLKLKGLDAKKKYRVEATGEILGGDELMYSGLVVPELIGDFQSYVWKLRCV